MSCVITHICKDEKYHLYSDHRKQANNIIKMLFHGLSQDEMNFNKGLFCSDYTHFDNKNGSFDGEKFIWKSEDIRDGNSNLWH